VAQCRLKLFPADVLSARSSWAIPTAWRTPQRSFLQWAETQGLRWDKNDTPGGERWGCRMEIYHTNPLEQPDMNAWRTELAFRLADGTTPS
jgi:type IV secretory pathway TraG/TraD family ATPase VirD4